ncbi:DMT family transporter [Agrococcus sp. ARC_14]|uniref:DMT family transporter n=1 Tax=Agrococcus sp. ARC_14 TaxID=2919927 RepID=UPI001F0686EE|nr:DMT family transporter [Agrococcus sp. ARC_14]MCH1884123.1 DMT family transporter [Agrococcus sp. ARC_14]
MSDEQPTSWRERFFGSTPASDAPTTDEQTADEPQIAPDAAEAEFDSAEVAPDEAEVAATSVEEHDAHQPLVEHDGENALATDAVSDDTGSAAAAADDEADTAVLDTHRATDDTDTAVLDAQAASDDRGGDSPIEPTVIAPSTLRGPSHSAAHPDDEPRATADEVHGEAADSSLEHPATDTADRGDTTPSLDAADAGDTTEPPALVEPRRPSFGLRRRSDDDQADASADHEASGADAHAGTGADTGAGAGAGIAAGGLAAAAAGGAAASSRGSDREFVEPEPTQALDTQTAGDQQATRAMDAQGTDGDAETRVLDAQEPTDQRTERFGIIRDEVPPSSIPVDDETARAAASGGTPIVLVEEPMPPRRKGARGVGFAVALLATLIFGLVFAAAYFAVGYLFDRAFDATETLQTVWLRPSFLLPVVVFFLAYWIVTLLVNRAGWWAHVLGGFIVALLVYAAHIGGAFMEEQGGWAGYTALPGIDPQSLGQLLLAPLSVVSFIIAREVPIWVGGIVARRGRKAREWNRQALDDFNAENAERLAAYERARG